MSQKCGLECQRCGGESVASTIVGRTRRRSDNWTRGKLTGRGCYATSARESGTSSLSAHQRWLEIQSVLQRVSSKRTLSPCRDGADIDAVHNGHRRDLFE